jgi:hypothetical protein
MPDRVTSLEGVVTEVNGNLITIAGGTLIDISRASFAVQRDASPPGRHQPEKAQGGKVRVGGCETQRFRFRCYKGDNPEIAVAAARDRVAATRTPRFQ